MYWVSGWGQCCSAFCASMALAPPTWLLLARVQALLAGMMTRLEGMLGMLCQQGFAPLEHDYYAAWLHSGQEVSAGPLGCQPAI